LIRLFTTWYAEPSADRRAEYAECLRRNLACRAIDEVCVLAENGDPDASAGLHTRRVAHRPDYADYFEWINEIASRDDISIIGNADIFFDDGVAIVALASPAERTAFALSRWDISPEGQARLYDHNDSQDSWIFRGPIAGVRGDFPIGVPRCDNRFAKELELAGYEVRNPSFSVRSFHLHAGNRDIYPVAARPDFVAPPYGYIWPHNLWPLHKTLWHNAMGSAPRVHWRFDARLWKRRLKLHWLARLSGRQSESSTEPRSSDD